MIRFVDILPTVIGRGVEKIGYIFETKNSKVCTKLLIMAQYTCETTKLSKRTPLSLRPKQGPNFAWGQQSGAWGASWKRKFAWGLLGVGLSLLAQFIITSFPDFPIFRIFGLRNGIPQVGFLGVCLGFAWGLLGV